MQLFALVNPKSGGGTGHKVIKELKESRDPELSVLEAKEISNQSIDEALQRQNEYTHLLVAGGDGTASWAAGRLSDLKLPVIFMGRGTANDLAGELDLKKLNHLSPIEYCKAATKAPVNELTVWKIINLSTKEVVGFFVNYFSVGFDGAVVESFHSWRKNSFFSKWMNPVLNRLLYVCAGLRHLGTKIAKDIQVNDQPAGEKQPRSLFFANIKCALGMAKSNLKSDPRDDLCELVTVNSLLSYPLMIAASYYSPCAIKPCREEKEWIISKLPQSGIMAQIDGEPLKIQNTQELQITKSHTMKFLGWLK